MRCTFLCRNEKCADNRCNYADCGDKHRHKYTVKAKSCRRRKRSARNNRADIRFIQISAHSCNVTDIVADIIGNAGRVTRIVLRYTDFDFADYVVQMVKDSGAQGLVLFMQQFCDPEEMEYPYLKKALDDASIPHVKLGVDQQMRDFGQASTAIQAFADVL